MWSSLKCQKSNEERKKANRKEKIHISTAQLLFCMVSITPSQ